MRSPLRALVARALPFLLAGAAAACGGDGPSGPAAVASISIGAASTSMIAGTTQSLTATAKDGKGNTLTGRTLRWTSSDGSVAGVSSAGLVTAVSPGSVTITAESEGRSGTVGITVTPVPVATVVVTPPTLNMVVGSTQTLVAQARDAIGNGLTGRPVQWSSASPAIAVVTAAGVVTAVAPGVASINATAEGKIGSATVTVEALPDAPRITAVTPATLTAGATATITGVGFEPVAIANTVTVNGVRAPIVSATATQIVFSVPCVESGDVGVRVAARGVTGQPFTRTMSVPQRALGVGEALILTNNAAALCNELLTPATTSARYLVMPFSSATGANQLLDFDLAGNTPPPGAAAMAMRVVNATSARIELPGDAASVRQRAQDAVHFQHLERERTELERLTARWRALPASRRASAAAESRAMVRAPGIGDERDFFYILATGCNDTTAVIKAKAIHLGTKAVIWEDVANTLQSSADAALLGYYQRLGRIYDEDQHESLKNTFGDPLLRDASTDNDGLVHMVFSQRLNGSGAAAYVSGCDQFPRTVSPGSNFGEIFYGSVPTVATPNVNSTNNPEGWFYFMARTVVHEVKHIVSIATRVANGAPGEQSWLEEGTARHAEEVWVRESLHHVPWRANTGFGAAADNGLYCDFHPTDATCNAADPLRRPSYGMRRQFNEIRPKLGAPEAWSPYGDGQGQSGSVFYQTAWSLVRYTIDRYAQSDKAFFNALLGARTNGTTNLAAVAGVPLDQLIGGWGLALYADDYPGITSPSPDIQFPTWNLRSIYAGLNASPSWKNLFPNAFPIQPVQVGFGEVATRVTGMRGGAHSYFEISGPPRASQLVALRGVNNSVAPINLRLAILRLQ